MLYTELMDRINEITKARTLAKIAHAGQKYGTGDYFEDHVFKVATRVLNDPDATDGHMVVAYLHDVVEDTHVTIDDLIGMGFGADIIAAVEKMTRPDGMTYNDYVREIAADRDEFSWIVKYHDLHENWENSKDGNGRAKRYENAIAIMNGER